MKVIFIVFLMLLAVVSQASEYSSEQQTLIDGLSLSFQLGAAYQKASQGQNVADFNALADQYNSWIRQIFGEDPNLLVPKMNTAGANTLDPLTMPDYMKGNFLRKPFADNSSLSKFGKQEVLTPISAQTKRLAEADAADSVLRNF